MNVTRVLILTQKAPEKSHIRSFSFISFPKQCLHYGVLTLAIPSSWDLLKLVPPSRRGEVSLAAPRDSMQKLPKPLVLQHLRKEIVVAATAWSPKAPRCSHSNSMFAKPCKTTEILILFHHNHVFLIKNNKKS